MSVKLYGVAGSPNVRGAMIGLVEKGVDFEQVQVLPAEFKSPEDLALNPFGRVPVLDHDGFVLYETQAILRYVDAAFAGPVLTPAAPRAAARMSQVMAIVDAYLFKSWSGDIGLERLVAPHFFGRPSDMAVIAAALPAARVCAEALEALLADRFLAGDSFSLADARVLPHFDWFRMTPEGQDILADKPKLAAWFAEASQHPSAQAVLTPL